MVPSLIFAGLPYYSLYSRDKALQKWFEGRFVPPNWHPHFFWSRAKDVDLNACWDAIVEELARVEADSNSLGVHALLFHKDADRGKFVARFGDFHRFRFLNLDTIKSFGTADFRTAIEAAVEIEAKWGAKLRPIDVKHSLLLPSDYFNTTPFLAELWARAKHTATSADIDEISIMLQTFDSKHLDESLGRSAYFDLNRLYFKLPKTRDYHGIADDNRENLKFTYRIKDGFHYDVGPADGKGRFELTSRGGATRTYTDNVNVYPHGSTRE